MKKILLTLTLISANMFSAEISQADEKSQQEKLALEKISNTEKFFRLVKEDFELIRYLMGSIIQSGPTLHFNTEDKVDELTENLYQFVDQNELDLKKTEFFLCPNIFDGKLELDPLRYAILLGNLDLIKLMISKGADTNNLLNDMVPLSFALKSRYHKYDILKLLLDNNSNPNLIDKWGFTPLTRALLECASSRHGVNVHSPKYISLMFDYGANHKLPNLEGKTAEMILNSLENKWGISKDGFQLAKKVLKVENENLYWRAFVTGIIHSMKVLNPPLCRLIADYSSNR